MSVAVALSTKEENFIREFKEDPRSALKQYKHIKDLAKFLTRTKVAHSIEPIGKGLWRIQSTPNSEPMDVSSKVFKEVILETDLSTRIMQWRFDKEDRANKEGPIGDDNERDRDRPNFRYEEIRTNRIVAPENVVEETPIVPDVDMDAAVDPLPQVENRIVLVGNPVANPLPEPEIVAGPDTTVASTDIMDVDENTGALVTTDLRPNPGALMPPARPMEQSGALIVPVQPGAVSQVTNPYSNVTSVPIGTYNQDVRLLQNVEMNMQNNQFNQQNNQYNQFVDATTNNLVQYFQQNNYTLDDQRLSELQQGISYIAQQNFNNQARTEAIEQLKLQFQEALVTGQTNVIASSIANASVQQSMQNAAIVDNINQTARALSGDLGTVYKGFMDGLSNLSAVQMAGNERQLAMLNEMLIQIRANQPPPTPSDGRPPVPPSEVAVPMSQDQNYDWNSMAQLVAKFQQGGDNQEIKGLLAQMLGILKLQNRKEIQQQLFQENAPREKTTSSFSSRGIGRPKNFTRFVLFEPSVITNIGWDSKILPKK